jgi:potassium voltage-gated channel Shaker-related subfamily A member 1
MRLISLIRDVIKLANVQNAQKKRTERREGTSSDSSQDRVIINVSGTRFETEKSTLEQYPETLLGSEKRRKRYYDKIHNEYFFNRHRQAFEAIIYFYQSHGRLRRPNSVAIDTFLEEITFFELGKEVLAQLRKEENLEAAKKTLLPRNRRRRYLWATLEYPEYSFIAKCVHILSLLVIGLSTLSLTVESLPQYTHLASDACRDHYQQQDKSKDVNSTSANLTSKSGSICLAYFTSPFTLVQTVCVGFFTLELILRVISMPSFCGFIKSPMNWIDVFAIVPFYITSGLRLTSHKDDVHTNTYTGLQLLRILRFTRVFKFYRIFKNVKAIRVLALTLRESLPDFLILIAILTSLALLFGAAAYFAESIDSTTKFDSIPMAIYWGVITITSVG